ncbi:Fic family protein [Exiguobacterium sp. TDN 0502]|uniref:Fic family protein n=1 Tax=Exiguobacterium sp. TDN 0502 TaxID=3420731 RepID=UPI003D782E1C
MTIQGVGKLPISITTEQAANLGMKLARISSDIGRLDEKFKTSLVTSNLINTLALKESVQSTRIEGTHVTFTDMVENSHSSSQKWEYIEVMNYQKALFIGQERIRNGYPLSTRLILELHQILMQGARGTNVSAGEFRKVPNWIGPTNRREDAVYIPVDAQDIETYLENWENYANRHAYGKAMDLSHLPKNQFVIDEESHPLLKVAVLHAQFESIHPFLDGNGRLGRIIIALYMMQTKQISSPIFLVSEELEKQRAKYYHLLNGTRGQEPDWSGWINFFLDASERMTQKLNQLLDEAESMAKKGIAQCETATQKNVYLVTFSQPNSTASQMAKILSISPVTARNALNYLSGQGLLFKDTAKKRNVEYWNYGLLELVN